MVIDVRMDSHGPTFVVPNGPIAPHSLITWSPMRGIWVNSTVWPQATANTAMGIRISEPGGGELGPAQRQKETGMNKEGSGAPYALAGPQGLHMA